MVPDPGVHLARARVLVVEDEVLIRGVLADELREAGFSVIEASNADEALSYLEAGEPVDLIFSDIHMPGSMDGVDLAKNIRGKFPGLPVVLTSGNPRPGDRDAADLFLPKPYRVAVALSRIAAILGV